jgi:hypothetical protein
LNLNPTRSTNWRTQKMDDDSSEDLDFCTTTPSVSRLAGRRPGGAIH